MDNKELKKLLQDTLDLENELYDFCIECLNKIYGDNGSIAVREFKESYNFYDYNGCLQSLESIDSRVQKEIKFREERKAKAE